MFYSLTPVHVCTKFADYTTVRHGEATGCTLNSDLDIREEQKKHCEVQQKRSLLIDY